MDPRLHPLRAAVVRTGQARAFLALAAACSLWGGSFLFAKVALAEMDPGHVLLYRFGLAAAPLSILVARSHVLPRGEDWPLLVLTGILCVPVTMLVQLEGLTRTSVTSASLIVGTGTPLLALAAVLFERERLGRIGWLAVALSCLGITVMVGLPGAGRAWLGDLLVFLSMAVSAAWILLSRRLVRRYPPAIASAWILIAGTVVLVPIVLAVDGSPPVTLSASAWGSLIALAVGCTVAAFLLWNWGVDRVAAGRAAPFINLQPVVGAALGILLMRDALGLWTAAGGTLVLLAAALASLPGTSGNLGVAGPARTRRPSARGRRFERSGNPPASRPRARRSPIPRRSRAVPAGFSEARPRARGDGPGDALGAR
ncbi:MAG: DMT family transporter [Gemmatimonadota bacterium]